MEDKQKEYKNQRTGGGEGAILQKHCFEHGMAVVPMKLQLGVVVITSTRPPRRLSLSIFSQGRGKAHMVHRL